MAEITQHLGFEAAAAIATLKQLDAAIGGVNRRLGTFNQRAGAGNTSNVIQGFAQLTQQANQAYTAVNAVAGANQKAGQTGQQAGQQMTLSWQTLLRVVQTQALVKALSLTQQLFTESADAAEEFQIQIARISTIAQGQGSGFDELSASVRELSVELGRPVNEVAAAAYETLQNDIGDTAESFDFLREAAGLAISQGSEIEDAVSTLTSVLKSYGLTVEDTADVSDTLFVAIDKGRITLDEIADKLGTVVPLAATLGINFQQTAAATASLTQSGLDSATAMTQLRNVLQKILKPGDELQAAFERLGVTTGTELISKFGGLQGALQALKEAFAGNEQEVAKAFGTIRGQLGVLNFLANEGTLFNETLQAMEGRAGKAAEAIDKVNATDAREAQKSFAQLNDTILGVGESTQKIRTAAVDVLNFLVPNSETATTAVLALGAAFTVLGAKALIAAPKIAAALAPLLPIAAAIAAALAVAFATDKAIKFVQGMESASDEVARITEENQRAQIAAIEGTTEAQLAILQEEANARKDLADDWVGYVTAKYDSLIAVAQDFERQTVSNATASIKSFADAREKAVKQIEQAITEIDERIVDLTRDIADSVQDLREFNFERGLKDLTEQERVTKRIALANSALAEARQAAATAGIDEESQAAAKRLQDIAEARAEEALSAADKLGDEELVRRAEGVTRSALKQDIARQYADQKRLSDFRKQDATDAANELADRTAKEKELAAQIIELQKEFGSDGKAKSVLQLEEDREQARALKGELADLLTQDLNVDLFKQLGVQDFVTQTTTSLVTALSQAEVNWTVQADALQAVLSGRTFTASVSVAQTAQSPTGNAQVDAAIGGVGAGPNSNPVQVASDIAAALTQLKADAITANAELQKQGAIFTNNKQKVDGIIGTNVFDILVGRVGQAITISEAYNVKLSATSEALVKAFDVAPIQAFGEQMKVVSANLPAANAENQASIQAQIDGAKTLLLDLVTQGKLSAEQAEQGLATIKAAEAALAAKIASQDAAKNLVPQEAVDAATTRLQEIENKVNEVSLNPQANLFETTLESAKVKAGAVTTELQGTKTKATEAGTATGTITTNASNAQAAVSTISASMGSVVGMTNAATSAMRQLEAAARAAAAAAAAATSGGASYAYHGGRVNYRAVGGPIIRGGDTQMTMTKPGEMIMNARQSRNFSAELQAMNAGQRPQFREKGGTVTNVGDVNVSIHTTSVDPSMGPPLARSIQRTLRRQTSDL